MQVQARYSLRRQLFLSVCVCEMLVRRRYSAPVCTVQGWCLGGPSLRSQVFASRVFSSRASNHVSTPTPALTPVNTLITLSLKPRCVSSCIKFSEQKQLARFDFTYLVCSLFFYVLATSKIMAGQVLICDSVHSWQLYNAAPQRDIPLSHIILILSQSILALP